VVEAMIAVVTSLVPEIDASSSSQTSLAVTEDIFNDDDRVVDDHPDAQRSARRTTWC
jgi:hypothetical protein